MSHIVYREKEENKTRLQRIVNDTPNLVQKHVLLSCQSVIASLFLKLLQKTGALLVLMGSRQNAHISEIARMVWWVQKSPKI